VFLSVTVKGGQDPWVGMLAGTLTWLRPDGQLLRETVKVLAVGSFWTEIQLHPDGAWALSESPTRERSSKTIAIFIAVVELFVDGEAGEARRRRRGSAHPSFIG
jgi:hypothetical protein